MKVDDARYRVIRTRTFWIWWLVHMISALSLYLGLDALLQIGDAGYYVALAVISFFALVTVVWVGYIFWMGVQSFRTEVYPPIGSYVLATWKTADGSRARIYGVILATLGGATLLMIVWAGVLFVGLQ